LSESGTNTKGIGLSVQQKEARGKMANNPKGWAVRGKAWGAAMRTLVILMMMVVGCASELSAQSQRQSQSDAVVEKVDSAQEQRGTEQSPIVVEIKPPPDTDEQRAEKDQERKRVRIADQKKEESDQKLVDYTGVLALFTQGLFWATAFLFLATVGLLVAAFRQSQDARAATEISRSALTELEAPFLIVKIDDPGIIMNAGEPNFGELKFCIANYGRTAASVLELYEDIEPVPLKKGLPWIVKPDGKRGSVQPFGVVAPPGGASQQFRSAVRANIFEDGEGRQLQPFFRGFVRYSDIFEEAYVLGFCFRFERESGRWYPEGNNDYNYKRKEAMPKTPPWYQPRANL
jgi:hypothetical protein